MYNVSKEYLAAIAGRVRTDSISGAITLAGGNDTINVSDANLVSNSLKVTRELCSGSYRIGTFNLSCLRFGIFVDNALGLDLTGATAELSYSMKIGGELWQSVPLGKFLVDPVLSVRRKNILNIVAYDNGVLFDREPSDELRGLSGTPAQLIIAACEECGVQTDIEQNGLDNMPNSGLTVCADEKQIQTCRDIVMWCSALLCGYAVIDRTGKLCIIPAKYGVSSGGSSIDTDREIGAGERESIVVTDTRAYIKYLTAYAGDNIVNYMSEYVSTDEQASPAAYALEKNPLLAACGDEVCDAANRAWLAYIDAFKQRGVQARIFGDPAVDIGDTVIFRGGDVDQRSGVIGIITSYVWSYRGYQDIECLAAECCGSLVSSGSSAFTGGMSSRVRSQISKRVDAITGGEGDGGVGEYMDPRHTSERFNDYRPHTYDENTQKWVGGNHSDMQYDHVEGFGNKVSVSNDPSGYRYQGFNHVEGYGNEIVGMPNQCGHVEGWGNKLASGSAMHVGGYCNTVTAGNSSFVHGRENTVNGLSYGAVFGDNNLVEGASYCAVFGGSNTIRRNYCLAIGHGITVNNGDPYYFVIGGGAYGITFSVDGTGNVHANSYNSLGADYAEYFEWADGDPEGEDRCGMLVTLDGDKLIPAHGDDIFGIVSAAPSVVGNAYEMYWHGKFAHDVYGRPMLDENDEPLLAEEYDPAKEYIPRSKRKEWAAVGLTGRLVIRDDGSCKVGGYVSARRGVGTSCFKNTGVRVLRRIDSRHVEVLIK